MKTSYLLLTILGFGAVAPQLAVAGEPSDQPRERLLSQARAGTLSERLPEAGRERAFGGHWDSLRDGSPARISQSGSRIKITSKPHSGSKSLQPAPAHGEHSAENRNSNTPTRTASLTPVQLHNPGLSALSVGAKTGSMADALESQRRGPIASFSSPVPRNQIVPHRGAGPAILGGPAVLTAKNTTALNGTGMRIRQ